MTSGFHLKTRNHFFCLEVAFRGSQKETVAWIWPPWEAILAHIFLFCVAAPYSFSWSQKLGESISFYCLRPCRLHALISRQKWLPNARKYCPTLVIRMEHSFKLQSVLFLEIKRKKHERTKEQLKQSFGGRPWQEWNSVKKNLKRLGNKDVVTTSP